jgi:3-oxoacyl-[acyl-carrier protein] reductase
MSSKLSNRVALITGAGRGVGKAIAMKLASEGASIVVNDLDENVALETVSEIRNKGGAAAACVGSVTAPDFCDRFVTAAMENFGGIDIVINNAGFTWDSAIQKMTDEQWDSVLACHLTAPFRILRALQPVIRSLVKTDEDNQRRVVRKIVNVSSMAGMYGIPGQANYSAAKAGIIGMTRSLAKEWGRLNVTVNSVSYGLINTRLTEAAADSGSTIDIEGRQVKVGVNSNLLSALQGMIPLGHIGTTEEAAGAVYLMCLPESDYISGHNLVCSGGLTGI